jgi:hypothetical protein
VQAAAVLLLVELLVVLLIFLALAGGLAFGLHWVRGKTDWAFGKANDYVALVPRYTRVGTDVAVKPVIAISVFADTAKGTVAALRTRVQTARVAKRAAMTSRPVQTVPLTPPPPSTSTPQPTGEVLASNPDPFSSEVGARPVSPEDTTQSIAAR